MTYGPVAGSGCVDVSDAGALAGTGAANSLASTFSKSPCGLRSVIVIRPVRSSATMPEMWPPRSLRTWSAPTMLKK